jgi:vitamin B12 transporter
MQTDSSVVRSVRLASALALALAASVATAAEGTASVPAVVVTATRVPMPLEEVLAPVIVIDRATIERSAANDAADLLRFHAGVEVARTGGPGQPTSVFIRGADSNHTLVLIDGVRINPGTIGLPALQNVTPDMVERIEVVKGPRSALWGSDAIGGVVNIVTRRGSRDGWVVEAGYGDYDTRKASVNGGFGMGERASLDFGVAWLDSDGFPTRTGDDTDRGYDNLNANVQWRAAIGAGEVSLRHVRVFGFLPDAGRPGLRDLGDVRGVAAAGRAHRRGTCRRRARDGPHRPEPVRRFPPHGP